MWVIRHLASYEAPFVKRKNKFKISRNRKVLTPMPPHGYELNGRVATKSFSNSNHSNSTFFHSFPTYFSKMPNANDSRLQVGNRVHTRAKLRLKSLHTSVPCRSSTGHSISEPCLPFLSLRLSLSEIRSATARGILSWARRCSASIRCEVTTLLPNLPLRLSPFRPFFVFKLFPLPSLSSDRHCAAFRSLRATFYRTS